MTSNKADTSSPGQWRWLFIPLLLLVFVALALGMRWATFARPPLPEAIVGLDSNAVVEVVLDPWLTFSPAQTPPKTGFIFYPGGRIDPRGYAPLMQAIAADGNLVVVPEMPLNMAVFRPNIADEIMTAYPNIENWIIGGHSVGGTMAAQYANENQETVDGLVIWASYPADNTDLSETDLPVTLIYGSLDPRVNDKSVAKRQHLLPADTHFVRIDGGDHHQFGAYEIKLDEHFATISSDLQQEKIIESTRDLLRESSIIR